MLACSSSLFDGTWPSSMSLAVNPSGPMGAGATSAVTTGAGSVEELGPTVISARKSAVSVLRLTPMPTTATAGASLLTVVDVGHSASAFSVVVVPYSTGCYLSVGSVVGPLGAVVAPSANAPAMLIDVSSAEAINDLTRSANLNV